MKKKRRRRRKIIINKRLNLIFSALICICLLINGAVYMYRVTYPYVLAYAKNQLINIATLVIKQGIADSEVVSFDIEDAIMFEENYAGEISSIVVNTPLLNRLLISTTHSIEEKLLLVEEGNFKNLGLSESELGALKEGVGLEVPLFAALNLSLLHEYGPKIPISISIIGNAQTDVFTEVTEYGINNGLLEISLAIDVAMQIQLPFKSEQLSVSVNSPLIMKMINGPIPEYYYIGNSSASPLNPLQSDGSNVGPEIDATNGLENILLNESQLFN